ncbi:MAG: HAD family phosphatase [Burkholderiales bacterium]
MNVVFDFGGVLFQWQPIEFMARLVPERATSPAALQALVDEFFQGYGGDWAEFDRGTLEPGALAEAIAQRTGLALPVVRELIDGVALELQPVPGMVALLRRLHAAGSALFFLSNMPAPYARRLEASHEFLSLFRGGVYSSQVRLIKPEPAIYAHALEVFGIEARHTLFIDDVAHNVEAARVVGWQALHFHDPAQCQRELVSRGLLPAAA